MKHRKNKLPLEQRGGMSLDEAKDYLGIGYGRLGNLIRQGELKTAKIGKRVIVVVASARALLHGEAAA
jgi:hypothetical protein